MISKFIYALVIFSSAFLLFQVQPIMGKTILPWFGGSAGVWIVCLVFFQVVLLLGYSYAHLLIRRFQPRTQARIHAGFLFASLLALPIVRSATIRPLSPGYPAFHILWLLTVSVGLPYFLLSATSPLLQAWYVQKVAQAAPYRLYAVSNVGSMLALLSYPFLVEPWVGTSSQGRGWSWAYACLAVVCAFVALNSARGQGVSTERESASVPAPDWRTKSLWISLAACGSALLLTITHHITQNIAAVPLLWIIPLALYLLSFILCFEGRAWYRPDVFLRLLGVALGSMAYAVAPSFAGLPFKVSIPLFCSCLFVCCMFCHGELARLKPDPAHLTSFYLMISLGGALGAVLVALVAPAVFSGDYELRIAIGFCALVALVVQHRDPVSPFYRARWELPWLLVVSLAMAIVVSLVITARDQAKGTRLVVRNFYGVLRIVDETAPNVVVMKGGATSPDAGDYRYEKLMNGTIDHGLQFLSPALRDQPTTYYAPESGIGIALKAAGTATPLNVGVIGLGVGTLAAYGRRGDHYEFYEINPLVVRLAGEQFSFLRDSLARIDIVLGDGRLSLEREPHQGFDVLAVDAFSGDSIPVHLLTLEATELYFRYLKPQGVLAVHVSNRYLNLIPVVATAALKLNKEAVVVENKADKHRGIDASSWVLVGNPEGFLGKQEIEGAGTRILSTPQILWTDDYSSLFKVLM
jgi:hypothetical protein